MGTPSFPHCHGPQWVAGSGRATHISRLSGRSPECRYPPFPSALDTKGHPMTQIFTLSFTQALGIVLVLGFGIAGCGPSQPVPGENVLEGKIIFLDPGHGGTAETDDFRVGPAGEREEWMNLRVALVLRDLLEARGARVFMSRTEDVAVPLQERADSAVAYGADVFLSIHHNATADPAVNFPIIYFHGNASENQASVALGRSVARELRQALFAGEAPVSLVSDHVIFPAAGAAVLSHSYGIPGIIGEASFFTHPPEEERLKDPDYNRREAEAYLAALEEFFAQPKLPIKEKYSTGQVPPFAVLQEGERMNIEAERWEENYFRALELMEVGTPGALADAFDLFTLSARSFPDSWVANECHLHRAEILEALGRHVEAEQERRRVQEFYVPVAD
jgi:N-acetylmuramoyl-L-alanine amidase